MRCFKTTRILYYLFGIGGFIGIWALISYCMNSNWGQIIGILLGLLWIFVINIILTLLAIHKLDKINKIIVEDCNPEKAIQIYNKLLLNQKSKNLWNTLVLNLSAGYLNIGNVEKAKETLSNLNEFKKNRFDANYCVIYYNLLASCYLVTKELEKAADAIEKMKTALNNKKMYKSRRTNLFWNYIEKLCLLNMENNNYDGAELIFNTKFERTSLMIEKVSAKYRLGLVYLHDNRPSEAKKAFEYVVKNGGSLYIVQKSKEQLEQLTA